MYFVIPNLEHFLSLTKMFGRNERKEGGESGVENSGVRIHPVAFLFTRTCENMRLLQFLFSFIPPERRTWTWWRGWTTLSIFYVRTKKAGTETWFIFLITFSTFSGYLRSAFAADLRGHSIYDLLLRGSGRNVGRGNCCIMESTHPHFPGGNEWKLAD
jgi:hypothetical protein